MSVPLIQYFVHDATINGSRVGGSQTLTISKAVEPSNAQSFGNPFADRSKFRRKPRVDVSLQKMLSDDYGSTIPLFDIRDLAIKRPVDKYDLGATIYGGGSIKLADCVLTGLSYNFSNQGWFTEELSFEGSVSEQTAAGAAGTGLTRTAEGTPYQRQHFLSSTLPAEVDGEVLLSVSVDLSIGYDELVSYGTFYTYETKFVQVPISVNSTFEILDRGYSQTDIDYIANEVMDSLTKQAIVINSTPVSIDLGDKNILVTIERRGANAGDSNYSTLAFTYTNINDFKLL